jgi:hypothetical protein
MAGAVRSLITDPELAARMATVASSIGTSLHWPVVAEEYESIASRLMPRTPPAVAAITGSKRPQLPAGDLAKVG